MKKFYAIGLALLSVFAFSAVAAGSAFGVEPQWLVKSAVIPAGTTYEAETSGSLTLIHLAGGFLEPEAVITCNGVFDGLVLPKGEGTVEKLLNTAKEEITLTLTLACTNVKSCASPLVTAENLPWKTQLVLMEVAGKEVFLDLFSSSGAGLPAYEIRCDTLGIETLCEGETSATVELMTGSVVLLGKFNAKELEGEGLEGNCETHSKVALQEGEGEIKAFEIVESKRGPEVELDPSEA